MCYYLEEALRPVNRTEIINRTIKYLKGIKFNSVVVSGASGLAIGPIIAYKLRKNLVIIRKPKEKTHSDDMVEGQLGKSYIIIDDFIDTGATIRRILRTIAKDGQWAKCVGVYTYMRGNDWNNHKLTKTLKLININER